MRQFIVQKMFILINAPEMFMKLAERTVLSDGSGWKEQDEYTVV
jgi:hypothetical protein